VDWGTNELALALATGSQINQFTAKIRCEYDIIVKIIESSRLIVYFIPRAATMIMDYGPADFAWL
jgi:hypothetical protein